MAVASAIGVEPARHSSENLKLFATFFVPILIHMVCIILLMSFITMVLLRRWMKLDWFELALIALLTRATLMVRVMDRLRAVLR